MLHDDVHNIVLEFVLLKTDVVLEDFVEVNGNRLTDDLLHRVVNIKFL